MEDLFDNTRDRWQKSFRHPVYQRLLFLGGIAILAAAMVFWPRLRSIIDADPRVGWPVVGVIGLATVWCFWVSVKAWECKILISPTAIKAWYLLRGRERISWDSMDRVVYKWRLLGHTLVLYGTDGARVRIRSSLKGYDEVMEHIRGRAPKHIVEQIDRLLFEEEEDEEPEPQVEAVTDEEADSHDHDGQPDNTEDEKDTAT